MRSDTIKLQHPDRLFIGGEWVRPNGQSAFEIRDSHTEQVVATVAEANEVDVARAVAAARAAFDTGPWPRMSHAERAVYLRAIAVAFRRRADEFARIWTHESGILYTVAAARIGGILSGQFDYYADLAGSFAFEERHRSAAGLDALLVREPVGVVAAIIPWNGPGGLMAQKCAPALLAGCTIVMKPSPEAPGAAYLMAEICEEVGLPAGVVNVLAADRAASESLVRNPDVDKVTFTGSTAAGRAIASACGERIARCTLELGGKSPAIVLDDYDIGTAARTIAGGCTFLTGQVCHSLTRVIVRRDRHDAMVAALAAEMDAMTVGDPFDPASDVGPLATDRQRDSVEHYIRQAIEEGATLAAGGVRPADLDRGYYVRPTLFAHVDNRSTIGQQEVFGPVLSVIAADDEAHAVALANDTIFGLNASVFTNDVARVYPIARQLRSGTVGHNASRTDSTISFGGFKQSGLGREGGVEGLLPFLEPKLIVMDRAYAE
jgi:aldehyde dehydrogenase (NAD+)